MTDSPLTGRVLREKLRDNAELQRRFARIDPAILDKPIGERVAPESLFDSIMVTAIIAFLVAICVVLGGAE